MKQGENFLTSYEIIRHWLLIHQNVYICLIFSLFDCLFVVQKLKTYDVKKKLFKALYRINTVVAVCQMPAQTLLVAWLSRPWVGLMLSSLGEITSEY